MLTIVFAGGNLSNPNLDDSCVPKARDQVGNGGVQNKTEAIVQDTQRQKLCSTAFFFFKQALNTDQHFRNSSVQVRVQSSNAFSRSGIRTHHNPCAWNNFAAFQIYDSLESIRQSATEFVTATTGGKKVSHFTMPKTKPFGFPVKQITDSVKPLHYSSLVMCTWYPSLVERPL